MAGRHSKLMASPSRTLRVLEQLVGHPRLFPLAQPLVVRQAAVTSIAPPLAWLRRTAGELRRPPLTCACACAGGAL